jgi:glycosyltransferase XagB
VSTEFLPQHGAFESQNMSGHFPIPPSIPAISDDLACLSRPLLVEAMRRARPAEVGEILRTRLVPVAWMPHLVLYAACGSAAESYATRRNLKLIANVAPEDFQWAVRKVWGPKLAHHATQKLAETMPSRSAKRRLTPAQALALPSILACLAASMMLMPFNIWCLALNAIVSLFFLSVVALRLFCLWPAPRSANRPLKPQREAILPVYTVLVPVFRETAVLAQLLGALFRLDYPASKLDIKIIVEATDLAMRRALARRELPAHIQIIVVPPGTPQTKPRALNYALQFARGSLLTIYDAEDIPEPNQLRAAARIFSRGRGDLACLQARLVFFNARENWLTRQFAAEYATLFGLILPALASQGLPLPLGGTSNHFRTDVLREVGGWDPYNVTEDADLGFRLARAGYRAGIMGSVTREEAATQYPNWFRQRARWIKGFMQTWLVHMRHPVAMTRELGIFGFWVLQSCTAGIFVSALFHPLSLLLIIAQFTILPHPSPDASPLLIALGGLNLAVFVLGYGVAMIAANKALRRQGMIGWWFTLATMPFYWLLMSAAAWFALWQFIFSPHTWNNTEHGLSKLRIY